MNKTTENFIDKTVDALSFKSMKRLPSNVEKFWNAQSDSKEKSLFHYMSTEEYNKCLDAIAIGLLGKHIRGEK